MAVRRERMERRLSAAPPSMSQQPTDTVVVFRDGRGEVARRYDLGKLGLPVDIAMLLADAFRHHHAASSRETQRHCWMALQAFARFVAEDGHILAADELTTAMVGRYIAWLDQQVWGTNEQALVEGGMRKCVDAASPDDRLDEAPVSIATAGADRLPFAGLAEPECQSPCAPWRRGSQGDPSRVL
jgi:hypothetical protein